jgi:hypothetical protein
MWADTSTSGGGALSSGLDDYPRGYRESAVSGVHSDLQGWMILFARFMVDFTNLVGHENGESQKYQDLADLALKQFHTWCWNDQNGFYNDRIIYEENPPVPNELEEYMVKRMLKQ